MDLTILTSPPWVDFEHKLSIYRASQCDKGAGRSLRQAIEERMRESSLGIFLLHLNRSQQTEEYVQRDKLDRLIFDMRKGLINMEKFNRNNDICEDLLALIEKMLENNKSGKITIKSSLRATKVLRLTGSHILEMDETLKNFSNLEVLVLAGNCLTEVPGNSLPRRLMILEVCCNQLQDLGSLLRDCPPYLVYLGLSRNYINFTQDIQSSSLHNIFHLDLSQNNIDNLRAVVSHCSHLINLGSLLLIGNPCSMVSSYKDFIASKLRKLSLLDGVRIKPWYTEQETDLDFSGSLQLLFYRLLSFPQPPNHKINKKKVMHLFRIEVDCPLLREFVPTIEEHFVEDPTLTSLQNDKENKISNESKRSNQPKRNKSPSVKDSNKKKQSKSKINIKGDKSTDRNRTSKLMAKTNSKDDIDRSKEIIKYESLLKEKISTEMCFISGSKTWNKIIEFDDPTIEIPNCSLVALRDTFRSYIIINVVHLMTLPAAKRKGSGKSKAKKIVEDKTESKNKDILVSKTIVAKIKIPLQDIVWDQRSLDYTWAQNNPLNVEKTSDLKNLKYAAKSKKGKKPKKGKDENVSLKNQLPTVFTCHFGIGVKRTEMSQENEFLNMQ